MKYLLSLLFVLTYLRAGGQEQYRVEADHGRWWIETPQNQRMWSFGVCCLGQGATWDTFQPGNPEYAAYKQFDDPKVWATDTFSKLRTWGFNSLGGWSDVELLRNLAGPKRLPYFEVLHLGAYAKAPFSDIFTNDARQAIEGAAKNLIPKLRDDPLLVGYFTDNELGWWGDTLFTSYLAMPKTAPGKQRLIKLIRDRYHDDFDQFKREWITPANSFAEFEDRSDAKLRPGTDGIQLVRSWLATMGGYYYSMVHDAVRAQDKSRLILGDRYCQFYELPIVQSSAPFLDVVSTNFGASWNDGSIVNFFLDTLNRATGRPVIITEFYMGAYENRSGNKNVPPAFPVVQTQKERAAAFATNVRALASCPYVIGAHWFQFCDEPPKGRGDGENFNHGLVDIFGRPYEEMVAAATAARPSEVHARSEAAQTAPMAAPAAPNPLKDLKTWSRDRCFIPAPKGLPFADLYACWDRGNLYLAVRSMEYTDEGLYEGGRIPESERSMWTIDIAGMKEPLIVRFGGKGRKLTVSIPGIETGFENGLQTTTIVKLSASLFGRAEFSAAQSIDLACTLSTHSRGQTMVWNTKVPLSR